MSMTPASALAFFASVIKSGEAWTPACQQAMDEALAHVYHLAQPAQSVDVDFTIDKGDPRILTWHGNRGCRPATAPEISLWDKLSQAIGDKT